ncbi:Trypsin-7, partial [Gryllus bimaculatus]
MAVTMEIAKRRAWKVPTANVDKLLSATYTVRVGSTERQSGGTVFEVKEVITHPKYNPGEHFDYDIALLELNGSIKISPTSQPVDLPDEGTPVEEGEVGVIAGWGSTDADLTRNCPQVASSSVTVVGYRGTATPRTGANVTPRCSATGEEEGGRDACSERLRRTVCNKRHANRYRVVWTGMWKS